MKRPNPTPIGGAAAAAAPDPYRPLLPVIPDPPPGALGPGQATGPPRRSLPVAPPASSLPWMVEPPCPQNLPFQPMSFDTELAASLTEIVWGALYLESVD